LVNSALPSQHGNPHVRGGTVVRPAGAIMPVLQSRDLQPARGENTAATVGAG
jgi:hypothetical protein